MYSHRYAFEVNFGECDAAQVVYFPRYFEWFDRATHALFEGAGTPLKGLAAAGLVVPLAHVEADFARPARWTDQLVAHSQFITLGNRSLTIAHTIKRAEDVIATGKEVRVFVRQEDTGFKAIDIPEEVRRAALGSG